MILRSAVSWGTPSHLRGHGRFAYFASSWLMPSAIRACWLKLHVEFLPIGGRARCNQDRVLALTTTEPETLA
jgi:hypothetical protein